MVYRTTKESQLNVTKCPDCGYNLFLYSHGSITCRNCGYKLKSTKNTKYKAIKTVSNDGTKCDSKFEATIADELEIRKLGGDIKDYEPHYKIELWAYGKHICNYYVDFLITHNDGHLEYYEVKSAATQTAVWRIKWKMLESKLDQEGDMTSEMTVRLEKNYKKCRKVQKKH